MRSAIVVSLVLLTACADSDDVAVTEISGALASAPDMHPLGATPQAAATSSPQTDTADGKVRTPSGLMDKECVHEVPNDAFVDIEGNVSVDGRWVKKLKLCGGRRSGKGGLPEINQYVESVKAFASNFDGFGYFNKIEATWQVPPLPPVSSSLQYYFPAIDNGMDTIIQPVLQFGPAYGIGSNQSWVLASWRVVGSGDAVHSPGIPAYYGDVVRGIVTRLRETPVYGIVTRNNTRGAETRLNIEVSADFPLNVAVGGAVEVYRLNDCSQFPSSGVIQFNTIRLYKPGPNWWNLNQYTPGWSHIINSVSPDCGYSITSSATHATFYF